MDAKESNALVRIERAAIELFARHGFDGVSVREIADASGVAAGSINYYFASKKELYQHCVETVTQQFLRDAAAKLDGANDPAAAFRYLVGSASGNNRLMRLWIGLQATRDTGLAQYSYYEILGPLLNVLSAALDQSGDAATEFKLATLSFLAAVGLSAILTDEQLEEWTGKPGAAMRRRWHEILVTEMEEAAPFRGAPA